MFQDFSSTIRDPLIVPNIICFSLVSHKNSRLIVVDAKDRHKKKLLYTSNGVNPNYSPVNNVCLLLFNNQYYPLTSLPAWYGHTYNCIECEVCYTRKHNCTPVRICSKCSEKKCLTLPIFTRCSKKCFGAFRNSTCLRNHLENGGCDNSKSCDTCGQWFIGSSARTHMQFIILQLLFKICQTRLPVFY